MRIDKKDGVVRNNWGRLESEERPRSEEGGLGREDNIVRGRSREDGLARRERWV